jgi:hypothetical protein
MKPDKFCKRVQAQMLKVEREQAKLHDLLSEGVRAFTPELTAMGVDVVPLSGGGPKPPREGSN